jgi:hypothetical protein
MVVALVEAALAKVADIDEVVVGGGGNPRDAVITVMMKVMWG